jgi:hypothetical protein
VSEFPAVKVFRDFFCMELKIILAATQHTCCWGILSLGRGYALSDLTCCCVLCYRVANPRRGDVGCHLTHSFLLLNGLSPSGHLEGDHFYQYEICCNGHVIKHFDACPVRKHDTSSCMCVFPVRSWSRSLVLMSGPQYRVEIRQHD